MSAYQTQTDAPASRDNLLGICHAIGEDFGFNPIFLRIPLAASVIWNPLIAIGTYFGLGAVVLVSRLLFPKPKAAVAVKAEAGAANEHRELAKAA